ncbi:hypothetical protein ACHAP1_002702 [Verticillium nonalfalfae]
MAQNYDVGTRAWQPDATEGWVASEVASKTIDGPKAKLVFQLDNGEAIRLRYAQKEIYTYSGIVLIATNPFARVDSLYVPGMVQVYAGKQRATQAPHLFAIAEEAFM